jgi:hypothetical protein
MRVLRLLAVLVLCLALGVSQASASPIRREAAPQASSFNFHDVLGRLGSLLSGLWSKEGCRIDPWGRCATNTAPSTDAGCGIDPLGCANSTPAAETGCGIDPWRCPKG